MTAISQSLQNSNDIARQRRQAADLLAIAEKEKRQTLLSGIKITFKNLIYELFLSFDDTVVIWDEFWDESGISKAIKVMIKKTILDARQQMRGASCFVVQPTGILCIDEDGRREFFEYIFD